MSFGRGFGSTPYGYQAPSSASGDPVPLHSARKIDAHTGAYELESTGEYKRMTGTQQRVLLVVGRTIHGRKGVISPGYLESIRSDLDKALSSTVGDAAEVKSIEVTHAGGGAVSIVVSYRDKLTGANDTAEASL